MSDTGDAARGPSWGGGWAAALGSALAGWLIHIVWHLWGASEPFQDDMRQHVFALQPTDDLFGTYFGATVPIGSWALAEVLAMWDIGPLTWARWIQPGLIALGAAAGGYVAAREVLRREVWGGWAAVGCVWILQAILWSGDDVVSSTPRSFGTLSVVLALAGALVASMELASLGALVAAAFYPPTAPLCMVLFGAATIREVWRLPRWWMWLWAIVAVGVTTGFLVAVERWMSVQLADFGPKITRAVAMAMPEFQDGGRAAYFMDDAWAYWVTGSRSGLVSRDTTLCALMIGAGAVGLMARRRRLPWPDWWPVALMGATALALFFAAHVMWLQLFHPNRHVTFALTVLGPMMGAAALAPLRGRLWIGVAAAVFALNVALSKPGYFDDAELARVVARLRADRATSVATFPASSRGAAIPLLARAPVVASVELSLPYHLGFYTNAAERLGETLAAWATDDPLELYRFLARHYVTHLLLEPNSWTRLRQTPDGRWKARLPEGFWLPSPWDKYYARQNRQGHTALLERLYLEKSQGDRPVVVPINEVFAWLEPRFDEGNRRAAIRN